MGIDVCSLSSSDMSPFDFRVISGLPYNSHISYHIVTALSPSYVGTVFDHFSTFNSFCHTRVGAFIITLSIKSVHLGYLRVCLNNQTRIYTKITHGGPMSIVYLGSQ